MSSLRRYRIPVTETKVVNIGGSVVYDICGEGNYEMIPWKLEGSTIDIETDETVLGTEKASRVELFLEAPADMSQAYPFGLTSIHDEINENFVLMNGSYVVRDIGNNLKIFVENSLANVSGGEVVDAGSIAIKGTSLVGRCRSLDLSYFESGDTFKITNEPPVTNFMAGSLNNGFNLNYFFKRPLNVKYTSNGIEKIVRFHSLVNDRD